MSLHFRFRRAWSAQRFKRLLNLYPPFVFNRIRIAEIAPDFRYCRVHVKRSLVTRNLYGTIFGGTIYSAADPIYTLMYWQILLRRGETVQAWLKSASASYRKPASSLLTLEFSLSDEDIERASKALDRDGRYARVHGVEAIDREGDVCAVLETEVHLRRPRKGQRETSGF